MLWIYNRRSRSNRSPDTWKSIVGTRPTAALSSIANHRSRCRNLRRSPWRSSPVSSSRSAGRSRRRWPGRWPSGRPFHSGPPPGGSGSGPGFPRRARSSWEGMCRSCAAEGRSTTGCVFRGAAVEVLGTDEKKNANNNNERDDGGVSEESLGDNKQQQRSKSTHTNMTTSMTTRQSSECMYVLGGSLGPDVPGVGSGRGLEALDDASLDLVEGVGGGPELRLEIPLEVILEAFQLFEDGVVHRHVDVLRHGGVDAPDPALQGGDFQQPVRGALPLDGQPLHRRHQRVRDRPLEGIARGEVQVHPLFRVPRHELGGLGVLCVFPGG